MSTDVPYNTTSGVSAVKFAEITAYAPETFADLRSRFGIPEKDFRQSILHSGPYVSFQSNSKGAARAGKNGVESVAALLSMRSRFLTDTCCPKGGVFFFTRDGAYMIKTIKVSELVARSLLLDRPSLTLALIIMRLVESETRGSNIAKDASQISQVHEKKWPQITAYSILWHVWCVTWHVTYIIHNEVSSLSSIPCACHCVFALFALGGAILN
jgi:hypothetical protein